MAWMNYKIIMQKEIRFKKNTIYLIPLKHNSRKWTLFHRDITGEGSKVTHFKRLPDSWRRGLRGKVLVDQMQRHRFKFQESTSTWHTVCTCKPSLLEQDAGVAEGVWGQKNTWYREHAYHGTHICFLFLCFSLSLLLPTPIFKREKRKANFLKYNKLLWGMNTYHVDRGHGFRISACIKIYKLWKDTVYYVS